MVTSELEGDFRTLSAPDLVMVWRLERRTPRRKAAGNADVIGCIPAERIGRLLAGEDIMTGRREGTRASRRRAVLAALGLCVAVGTGAVPVEAGTPATGSRADYLPVPANCVVPPEGLLAWWSMDNDLVTDVTGTQPKGLLEQSPVATPGKVFGGIDTSDGGVRVVKNELQPLQESRGMTVDFWLKAEPGQPVPTILDHRVRDSSGTGFAVYIYNDRVGIRLHNGAIGTNYHKGPVVATNAWVHVALAITAEGIAFYLNGEFTNLQPIDPASVENLWNEEAGITIGMRHDRSGKVQGVLDEVEIFSSVLSKSQIAGIASRHKCRVGEPQECNGKPVTRYMAFGQNGTNGDDVILGTNKADRIAGKGGDDLICGLRGNDRISGGEGNDVVFAGGGNDTVFGDDGNDKLNGESGKDTLDGGAGNDWLSGWDGDDSLKGGGGADRLRGNGGTDGFDGGVGSDRCWGDADAPDNGPELKNGETHVGCEVAFVK
jgi:hypothetical protein